IQDLNGNFFEGPWQPLSDKKEFESFEEKTPSFKWVSSCQALENMSDQGRCTYIRKNSLPGPMTRSIGGVSVSQDSWREELTFRCSYPSKNNCKALRGKGCVQIKSECLKSIGNRCVLFKQTFECESERGSLKRTHFKGDAPFCLGGDCVDQSWEKNEDLGKALSSLAVFQELKKDMMAVEGTAFRGNAMAC